MAVESSDLVPTPVSGDTSSGWGGAAVLVVPTCGLFVTVAAVVVVNDVNKPWTLALAMALVVIGTLCVIATIMRMLGGEDD